MARKITNDCCDCAVPPYPCLGDRCPLRSVTHYTCDRCGEEAKLYDYDGEELCEACLLETVPTVEGSE